MTDMELREKCIEVIRTSLTCDAKTKLSLYTEDGIKELPYSFTPGINLVWAGQEMLKANFYGNRDLFYDWTWSNVEIYPTTDPTVFWLEAHGEGKQNTGGAESIYKNEYIYKFVMEGTKIKHMKEYNNPLALMAALDLPIPRMPNGDAVSHTMAVYEEMKKNGEIPE